MATEINAACTGKTKAPIPAPPRWRVADLPRKFAACLRALAIDSNLLAKKHLDAKPNAEHIVPKLDGGLEAGTLHVFLRSMRRCLQDQARSLIHFFPAARLPDSIVAARAVGGAA
jgi:hypothetical protein